MDTPANPATPLDEVYQAFFADLEKEDTKQSTIDRHRYNILRFEKWLVANGHPAILASLERSILIVWTLCSLAVHDLLVLEGGWTPERYEAWLVAVLTEQLLGDR